MSSRRLSVLRREHTLRVLITWVVSVAVAVPGLALLPASAAARSVECQHPATTGEFAVNLRHVSAAAACAIVHAIPAYEAKAYRDHLKPLFRCVGMKAETGLHEFDGWHVGVVDYELKFWRGDSSFSVVGTDFGAYCG